ncbi:hypothetical protein MTP99_010674 [Tenebrio molitor]|jgi:hypothetical protein|nr:hypothetical protein MTP99_010674 [Tenebrio molitor]
MSKRKRVVLNFQQKLEILRQLNEGKSGTILAKQYGIGTSTISDIKRNADSILQFVSNLECEKHISEKKTRKTAQNTDLDSRVYKWYVEEKKKGAVPSDSAVCSKALEVNQQLTNGSQNFKASLGWLRHFKNRHGLEEVKEPCEESPTSATVARQFKNILKRGGYTLENVYSADDTILFWKSLPNYDNKSRNPVVVIACSNANASHKLPLCVIGREKKCKVRLQCSVIYKHHRSSGLNISHFEEWFENFFIPQVKQRQLDTGNVGKILLIIDDVPWHPPRDTLVKGNDKIDVFIIPDNLTPPIQPMEAEIKQFKVAYRKKLLELLFSRCPCPIKQFLEEFTLRESISVIGDAWDSIPRTQIVQSWGQLLSDLKDEDTIQDGISEIVAIAQKITGLDKCGVEDVTFWLESDKEDYSYNSVDDDMDFSSSETNQEDETEEGPLHIEAYQCLETAILWFQKQEECNNAQLSTLESLRDLAAVKICGKMKQEKD